MNTTTIKSKSIYFPTELWDEIKSYILTPEDKRMLCFRTADEWLEKVVLKQSKKQLAYRLREWSSEDTPVFCEMTDPEDKRYKRHTKMSFFYMLAEIVGNSIRFARWNGGHPYLIFGVRENYKKMKREIKLAL